MNLSDILYENISKEICEIEPHGIYALSFYVYGDCDNSEWPTITLGFNTDSQVQDMMKTGHPSDLAEAKWNYAFWLQNKLFIFGESDEDKTVVAKWKELNNIVCDRNSEETYNNATLAFVEELIKVSQRLHSENIILKTFGKSIPIIIHELEYYDTIAKQTERANPDGVASEFVNWIMDMY